MICAAFVNQIKSLLELLIPYLLDMTMAKADQSKRAYVQPALAASMAVELGKVRSCMRRSAQALSRPQTPSACTVCVFIMLRVRRRRSGSFTAALPASICSIGLRSRPKYVSPVHWATAGGMLVRRQPDIHRV